MSERGSFVTQYCYCDKCFSVLKKRLLNKTKQLCSTQIPSWCDQEIPIIAGKIGGLFMGEEVVYMKEIASLLEKELCHDVYICVIPEFGKAETIKAKGNNGTE